MHHFVIDFPDILHLIDSGQDAVCIKVSSFAINLSYCPHFMYVMVSYVYMAPYTYAFARPAMAL